MGDLSKRTSLKMSLLLFTLISTALAVPAPCPPMLPMECGEGMTNCPGPMDPMGCMMPETCVAVGDECPFYCPWNPPMSAERATCPALDQWTPWAAWDLRPALPRETDAHSTAPGTLPWTAERATCPALDLWTPWDVWCRSPVSPRETNAPSTAPTTLQRTAERAICPALDPWTPWAASCPRCACLRENPALLCPRLPRISHLVMKLYQHQSYKKHE